MKFTPIIFLVCINCMISGKTIQYRFQSDYNESVTIDLYRDRFEYRRQLGHSFIHSEGIVRRAPNARILFSERSNMRIPVNVSKQGFGDSTVLLQLNCNGNWFQTLYESFIIYRADTKRLIPNKPLEIHNIGSAYAKIIFNRPKGYDKVTTNGRTTYIQRDKNEQLISSEFYLEDGNSYCINVNINDDMRNYVTFLNDTIHVYHNYAVFMGDTLNVTR